MLRARDKSGKLVHIDEVENKQEEYFCLCCNQLVQIRKGRYNRGHFAHSKSVVKHSHDFSEHQYLQNYLRNELVQRGIKAVLEVKIGTHHRADLVCEVGGQKYALEIQRTAISYERLMRRIEVYEEEEYQIIWVIPVPFIEKETTYLAVNNWTLTLLQSQQKILFYCRKSKCFYQPYWYLKLSSQKIICDCKNLGVNSIHFFSTQAYPIRKKEVTRLIQSAFNKWKRMFHKTAKHHDELAQVLYRNQVLVESFPLKIVAPNLRLTLFTQPYFWLLIFIVVLFVFEHQTAVSIYYYCEKRGYICSEQGTKALKQLTLYCEYIEKIKHRLIKE